MQPNETTDATTAEESSEAAAPKKKKKYSRELEPMQKFERSMSKAQRRVAKAVYEGLSTWDTKREKSARKKRDGAVKDIVKNMAEAQSRFLEVTAKVPEDLATPIVLTRKQMRRLLKPFAG